MDPDIYAEACLVAVDDGMVHATWTVGDPARVTGRLHMPRRLWWNFITSVHERQLGMPNGHTAQ